MSCKVRNLKEVHTCLLCAVLLEMRDVLEAIEGLGSSLDRAKRIGQKQATALKDQS